MSNIILIDAYSQIYRTFYGMPMLTNPQGEPVNAVYGMARLFMSLDKNMKSTHGAIVYDKGKAKRRLEICPEYKAQRPPMPDALRSQIEQIRKWAEAFGWTALSEEGLEADDIIAAVTRRAEGMQVSIITADKDISQLTAIEGVNILTPEKGDKWKNCGRDFVMEKFGVQPELLGDYLALVGDTADNIAGIPGIGPKTASKMLNASGGIEAILANPTAYAAERIANAIVENQEQLKRNQELVALADILPESWNGIDGISRKEPDWSRLLELAESNGFKSMIPIFKKNKDESQQMFLF